VIKTFIPFGAGSLSSLISANTSLKAFSLGLSSTILAANS
jgi:hypothetical protein